MCLAIIFVVLFVKCDSAYLMCPAEGDVVCCMPRKLRRWRASQAIRWCVCVNEKSRVAAERLSLINKLLINTRVQLKIHRYALNNLNSFDS